jgi:chemotaxis protein MotB
VDRANATHRLIQENGVRPDQVTQVRGFADQELRKKDDPLDDCAVPREEARG